MSFSISASCEFPEIRNRTMESSSLRQPLETGYTSLAKVTADLIFDKFRS